MLNHPITRATRILLFWSLIAAAAALTVVRVLLTGVEDYRAELEQRIREATGLPIRIGEVSAGTRGINPELIARGIRIEATDNRQPPDIQLDELRLGLDLFDLVLTQDWMSSLWVTLVGADISIIRHANGNLSIKGLQASDEQPLWLFQGGKYEILRSRILWHDQLKQREPVQVQNLDLLLKNHFFDDSHEIHLLSPLPEQYGESLRVSAHLKGNLLTGEHVEGEVYVEGVDLQTKPWLDAALPLDFRLLSGAGDVRLWSQWRDSKPYQIAGYVQAQQIGVRKAQGKPVRLDTCEANFVWRADENRWRLAAYDINLFTNRQRWSGEEFYFQQGDDGAVSATIAHLDLPVLAHVAPLIIARDSEDASWLGLNPLGVLSDVQLYIADEGQRFAAVGRFQDMGNHHVEDLPLLEGFSGRFSVNNDYGVIDLDTDEARIEAGQWFRNPLQIKRLKGRIQAWQDGESLLVSSEDLAIDSADFHTSSRFQLLIPKSEGAPRLDLNTRFGGFNDISKVPLYLPAKQMGADAVAWLDDAFVAGRIRQGELMINGNLDRFPFADGDGRFEVLFDIDQGEIQINEDWPHLQDIDASVRFHGPDLDVAIVDGRSDAVDIKQAVVTIRDVADSERVDVLGQVGAPVMDALAYLRKTPLKPNIEPLLPLLTVDGVSIVDLDLKIPYDEAKTVDASVVAHLDGAQVTVKPVELSVDGVKGQLTFTEDGMFSNTLEARTLGYPVQAKLNSDSLGTYLNVTGRTDVGKLKRQFAFLSELPAKGAFDYTVKLGMPSDKVLPVTLAIDSALKGVAVDDVHGLGKTADDQMPLQVTLSFDDAPFLPVMLRYGSDLQAALRVDKARQTLYSGHIVLGQSQSAQPYEQPGLKLDIRRTRFNMAQALSAFGDDESRKAWPPVKAIELDTGQLIWQGQDLGPLHIRLQHANQAWQGDIDSPMAQGAIEIPDQHGGNRPITMRMNYVNLSSTDKVKVEQADESIGDLPLFAIESQHLYWRKVDLGPLKLQTERKPGGIHFKTFRVNGKRSRIDLTGDWLRQGEGTVTQMSGKLQSDEFGQWLTDLGITEDIMETHANIEFKLGWRGSPYQFGIARLNGQLKVVMEDGRISSIEPGFGRLFGLVAMEQWVKRLSLDFSDIYRQGLAFDTISGHFKIKDGLAFTSDLVVDAVAAKFSIAGFANLVDKTIDQRVAVVPKSSGAVPIAGTIVSEIAGAITQAVTDDYQEGYFFGSKYKLTGPWGNIEVTPLPDEDGLINKTWRGLTDFGWLGDMIE